MSIADELVKLKELLDLNIITKEEFNIKKNELLNKENEVKVINEKKPIDEINNIKNKKYKRNLTIIIIIVIILMIGFIQTEINKISNTFSNLESNEIIFNANDYYNGDRTNTITIEELKLIKGEPVRIENWDYEINETTSYPIMSVFYSDNEEYCFYNEHLAWILFENKVLYKNKNSIIKMFGLEENLLTQKIVDTGYALKYENCGVSCLWIQGIENNTFNWVKIIYLDIFK